MRNILCAIGGVKKMTVIVMGMTFDSESVPDFGSIRMTAQRHNNVNDYIVLSTDISKLDEITNAADGSTALAVDTKDLYVKITGVWSKVGGNG